MFESLSDPFEGIFGRLRSRGHLGDAEVDEVLREIRMALDRCGHLWIRSPDMHIKEKRAAR